MNEQEEKNFKHLVKHKNILIFGDSELSHLESIFEMFNFNLFQEVTEYSIDKLNTSILENSIDVIIVSSQEFHKKISQALNNILDLEDIYILSCVDDNKLFSKELINLSHSTFTQDICKDLFYKKLYLCLKKSSSLYEEPVEKDTYVDSFEIEIIFLKDELLSISSKIDDGDISKEIIQRVQQSINRINKIFENYLIYSIKIKKSMQYFAKLLENIDFNEASIENMESFEYLSRIIEDIAIFIDNYFIKRNFTDLYVIEDSLANSLKFLKDSFTKEKKNKEDGSSLEFFDD